jgi:MFS family permease
MAVSFTLASSERVRYATGAVMYFAQGIPQGLLAISIPVWLASQGVSAGDIGSYLAVIVLPWAFKLVTGPLMDRYEFLPMGRRRPWVLGAQLGLSLSLLALVFIERPAEQIGLLMLIGMLINSFAATQDVAVDGMSIDLTPVREQGRLNAFMSFGKTIGWAATAAVTGVLLTSVGLKTTAIAASAVAALALLVMIFVLEREGERTLPWTKGDAASVHRADTSFRAVFRELNKVLWVRTSLIVMTIMFFDGLVYGYGQALMPIAAVKLFGYTTPQWSQLVATMGLIGAVIALSIGPAGRKAHDATGSLTALRPCAPDRTDSTPVAELALCKGDALNLGDDAARRDGFRPCSGNGYLQERQLGDAIRDLHVGRKLRAFGGIENLRHGCRRIELRPVLHDAQRPVRRIDHRDPALQAPSFR